MGRCHPRGVASLACATLAQVSLLSCLSLVDQIVPAPPREHIYAKRIAYVEQLDRTVEALGGAGARDEPDLEEEDFPEDELEDAVELARENMASVGGRGR